MTAHADQHASVRLEKSWAFTPGASGDRKTRCRGRVVGKTFLGSRMLMQIAGGAMRGMRCFKSYVDAEIGRALGTEPLDGREANNMAVLNDRSVQSRRTDRRGPQTPGFRRHRGTRMASHRRAAMPRAPLPRPRDRPGRCCDLCG